MDLSLTSPSPHPLTTRTKLFQNVDCQRNLKRNLWKDAQPTPQGPCCVVSEFCSCRLLKSNLGRQARLCVSRGVTHHASGQAGTYEVIAFHTLAATCAVGQNLEVHCPTPRPNRNHLEALNETLGFFPLILASLQKQESASRIPTTRL